jgi:hypothetical protein
VRERRFNSGREENPEFMIGINGVDVWVNSENTDMMMDMDRIIDPSISANIQYGGALKDARGSVLEDSVANALRRKQRGHWSGGARRCVLTNAARSLPQRKNKIAPAAVAFVTARRFQTRTTLWTG